jgi:AbrB family looped-hinge helix DNA binding protein
MPKTRSMKPTPKSRRESVREVGGYGTVNSKGQVTISAGLRRSAGISPGDRVALTRQANGEVLIHRLPSPEEFFASLPIAKVPPIDWKAAQKEVAEELAEKAFSAIAAANERRKNALP